MLGISRHDEGGAWGGFGCKSSPAFIHEEALMLMKCRRSTGGSWYGRCVHAYISVNLCDICIYIYACICRHHLPAEYPLSTEDTFNVGSLVYIP